MPTEPESQPLTARDVQRIVRSELQRPGRTTLAEMGAASLQCRTQFMPAAATPADVQRLFDNHRLLQQLTSPDSRLERSGSGQLQEKVAELLATQQQPSSRRFQLSDTHSTKPGSAPGSPRGPDLTLHLAGRPAAPISTAAVIDLKRQGKDGEVEDPLSVGQAIMHAQRLLKGMPAEVRSSVLAAVTDMKSILWLKVERSGGGGGGDGADCFTTRAEAVRHDVMESLCALLQADPLDLGLDLPRVSLGGCPLALDELLGEGSSSVVYQCSGGGLDADAAAVKVPKQAYRSQGRQLPDAAVLEKLSGVAGVPRLLGMAEVEHGRGDGTGACRGVVLWPVVESLSSLGVSERRAVCLIIEQLVACLEAAHAAGLVNRDIRPDNLGLHRKKNGTMQLYIVDWGYAVGAVGHQGPYFGTLRCASDTVLQQLLQGGQAAVVTPRDDLVSLVRALRLWKWGDLQKQLAAATSTGCLEANAQACHAFWQDSARCMPPWRRVEDIAESGAYAAVAAGLKYVLCC